jgi:hypothetical protein
MFGGGLTSDRTVRSRNYCICVSRAVAATVKRNDFAVIVHYRHGRLKETAGCCGGAAK